MEQKITNVQNLLNAEPQDSIALQKAYLKLIDTEEFNPEEVKNKEEVLQMLIGAEQFFEDLHRKSPGQGVYIPIQYAFECRMMLLGRN